MLIRENGFIGTCGGGWASVIAGHPADKTINERFL